MSKAVKRKGAVDAIEKVAREAVRIGKDSESTLRIGYLRCYSGQELHEAVIEEFADTLKQLLQK